MDICSLSSVTGSFALYGTEASALGRLTALLSELCFVSNTLMADTARSIIPMSAMVTSSKRARSLRLR